MTTANNPIQSFDDFMDKSGERLMQLKWRWMDEKKYEDFDDYKKFVQNLFDDAEYLKFKGWTKGGKLTVLDENKTEITAKFSASGSVTINWKTAQVQSTGGAA